MSNPFYLQDVTLRDGMHVLQHRCDLEYIRGVAKALDHAKVDAIEVAHGDGLNGSSLNYGLGSHSDIAWIEAVAEVISHARLTTLVLPGIATMHDMKAAVKSGVRSFRVATHCTEADISAQHISAARDLGVDVAGFLMMAHRIPAKELAEQAKLMESYGAHCVYITDSAGALTPEQVRDRVVAFKAVLKPETQIGIHAHNNLSLAIANSLEALRHGAYRVDASLGGLGAGAGNAQIEAFVAAAASTGYVMPYGVENLMAAAESLVTPKMPRVLGVHPDALMLGMTGVYSSFLMHSQRVSIQTGVPVSKILKELARRGMVGGQEDMILDAAMSLAQ